MATKSRFVRILAVILVGLAVVGLQAYEWWANENVSNWEQRKEDIYTDYERYLDFQIQAQILRAVYNTLQAVNNSDMRETLVDREKEMLDYIQTSLIALTNHIPVESKSIWTRMGFYELMNVTLDMDKVVNAEYNRAVQEIRNWKQIANNASAWKFIALAAEVVLVSVEKGVKKR